MSEEDAYPPEEDVDDLDESTPADEEASPDADASPLPARSESSEHTHPQLAEIEQRMAWFLDHPEFDLCVVVEPESQSIVRIRIPLKTKRGFRSPRYGRELDVELTPDEAVRDQALYKLGFESFGERKGTYDGVRNAVFPQFTKHVTRAKLAAIDIISVMQDVFLTGDAWLWTFHVDDPDQWPDPLPKPKVWPPVK